MLTKVNTFNKNNRKHLIKNWFKFVDLQREQLLNNDYINYNVNFSSVILDSSDYIHWLNILSSVESDVFYMNNKEETRKNVKIIYENAGILYNSELLVTTLIVEFFYYMTVSPFKIEYFNDYRLLLTFFETNMDFLTFEEQQYVLLLKGLILPYVNEDKESTEVLNDLINTSSNDYIIGYAQYTLHKNYNLKAMYFDILIDPNTRKEKLEFLGCHNRVVVFDGMTAIANMFLNRPEECFTIQKRIIKYCSSINNENLYNFQIKQYIWTLLRLGNYKEIKIVIDQLKSNSVLFDDKLFLIHLTKYYLGIQDYNNANKYLEIAKIKQSNSTYDLFVEYLQQRLEGLDTELVLRQIIVDGINGKVMEVIHYYTPILIDILKEKRKYKDIVEMQYLILNTKIEQI